MSGLAAGSGRARALDGIRVVDLSTGIAGPMAAMFLADFGADVVKVESPGGDPGRSRPGFAMWNRNKRGVVVDLDAAPGQARLRELLAGADVCVRGGDERTLPAGAEPAAAVAANPGLVYLNVPPFLGPTPWYGGSESLALLAAYSGLSLRQSSFDGGPIDPAFSHVLYAQATWAAAAAVSALVERETSGHGQTVTVGGVHGSMIASTSALVIDRTVPEITVNYGPGGPSALYTRYRCADGKWLFLATLIPKFQRLAFTALGLDDVLADERVGGELENLLLPANRPWVRQRFVETFASRSSDEWLDVLKQAGVPVGPLLQRDDWLDSPQIAAIGMRAEVDDPEWGKVAMPANPINMDSTPAVIERPAPRLGEHTDEVADWRPRPAPASEAPTGGTPLAGLRILDLGAILAGPYAGTLLAELGADVIKVEVPAGDSWRDRGMPFIRGQRGVAIDLSTDAGREAFYALVRSADLVLDNYRAGVLDRLGITYERLRQVKPDIVCLSITAFGEDSPFALEPAFDPLLQARSGMMTAQGGDSEPVLLTVPVNDVTAAALAALGAVVSLLHRIRTGQGQRVWMTLAGTAALAQSEELIQAEGRRPPMVGGRDFPGPSALDRSYATSDGWVRMQATSDTGMARLQRAGLLPETADSLSEAELVEILAARFAVMTRSEALRALARVGVPAVPVRRLSELADDEEYERWEVFNLLERGESPPVLAPGRYARFSRTEQREVLKPPGVGEHTSEVLAEAGLSAAEIADLVASDAVRQGSPIVYRSFAAYR
jgi:crotonobetainyl-CoA:carnitine CoA-transferase CaiB-like acyl-CoA transferase